MNEKSFLQGVQDGLKQTSKLDEAEMMQDGLRREKDILAILYKKNIQYAEAEYEQNKERILSGMRQNKEQYSKEISEPFHRSVWINERPNLLDNFYLGTAHLLS